MDYRRKYELIQKVSVERLHSDSDITIMNVVAGNREKRMKCLEKGTLRVEYSKDVHRCIVTLYDCFIAYLPNDKKESINMLNAIVNTIETIRWKEKTA